MPGVKSYVDLFPTVTRDTCPIPECAEQVEHRHALAWQRDFLTSTAKYRCALGGYGSGKTLPACVLGVLLSIAIPGNIGIVCRRSYSKLHDSTERIFLEVAQRCGMPFEQKEWRDGWPHRIIFENGSEVVFRETKDLGRFLGPEYGWFLIDEGVEEPRKTWNDLVGRLRLPRAKRHLVGMLVSNPPSEQHWIAGLFGDPGLKTVEGAQYHTFRVSTRVNPFVPPEYVRDLQATHSPSEVRRIIDGFYGFLSDGKTVLPQFQYVTHVGEPEYHRITMVRSWDFGYHCPAVTWHQFPKCPKGEIHWHVLDEMMGKDTEAEPFATKVLAYSKQRFPDIAPQMTLDCGDPAGKAMSDKGPGPMIRLHQVPWNLTFRSRRCNLEPGLGLIRKALTEVCKCGLPRVVIHRKCKTVIDGMAGGYHYPRERPGEAEKDKPVKDGFFDNAIDTVRYAAENFFRELVLPDDVQDLMRMEHGKFTTKRWEPPSWSWMGWQ